MGEKRVVNFFESFRAVSLQTNVCHIKITSRKVTVLFCSIERGRQCGLRENSLYGYNWVLVFNF